MKITITIENDCGKPSEQAGAEFIDGEIIHTDNPEHHAPVGHDAGKPHQEGDPAGESDPEAEYWGENA